MIQATPPALIFHAGEGIQKENCIVFAIKNLCKKICDFVKWIFCGCCQEKVVEPSLKDRIQVLSEKHGFVWFYKKEENPLTEVFGNFFPSAVKYNGLSFTCSEAAYQAEKFPSGLRERFTHLNGQEAWALARRDKANKQQMNTVKVMEEVVEAKFRQNKELAEILLATGDAYLVEHTPKKGRDAFWADDHDGTGRNMLGRILMQTREKLGGTGIVERPANYDSFVMR